MSARHEHASSSDSGVSISCTTASAAGMASGSAMARGREVANQSTEKWALSLPRGRYNLTLGRADLADGDDDGLEAARQDRRSE